MKKFFYVVAVIASLTTADVIATNAGLSDNTCVAAVQNNGTFTRTSRSVYVYHEAGASMGSFAVYLHGGQQYINFNNTWICIQGKSRFGYCGNWYVIKR